MEPSSLSSSPEAITSINPLTPRQDRRLTDFLDERLLQIIRAHKKRSVPAPTSNGASHSSGVPQQLQLQTLSSYITAVRPLLAVILQIPPVDPSTPLRTTYLLRLTGDVLPSVIGYKPEFPDVDELLEWLDDLDQAWVVVLRGDVWDSKSRSELPVSAPAASTRATLPNPTERTRLRSLLLGGKDAIDEWMQGLEAHGNEEALKKLTACEAVEELFSNALDEMGAVVWDESAALANTGEVGMSDPRTEVTGEVENVGDMDIDSED